MINIYTTFRTGYFFWSCSIGSIVYGVWGVEKFNNFNCVFSLRNNGSKNELIDDCLITAGYVSWTVWSCKYPISESLYFSKVVRFLFEDKSRKEGSSISGILFWVKSFLSVMSVSFKNSDCFIIVSVFFLIGFVYRLWNGLKASNKN